MGIDRVYVVNLAARSDRWEQFQSRLPADWPFPKPERFEAIDLRRKKAQPDWFRQGSNAWGCAASHRQILERCISDDVDSVLILEDDAIFTDDFSTKAKQFLESMPDDWEWAYFGGNHLQFPSEEVTPGVWRCVNVNGTFGYAIRGRDAMIKIYKHLCACDWEARHHVDHRYGVLHKAKEIKTFCPRHWLVGHSAGQSNISGNDNAADWWFHWRPHAEIATAAPHVRMAAVVGPFRGGTSITAGVLHNLGVSMGLDFGKAPGHNPTGTFEGKELRLICRRMWHEPTATAKIGPAQRIEKLRNWGNNRRRQLASKAKEIGGGKHPSFCLMVPDLLEAWGPKTLFIDVQRPMEDVIASLVRCNWAGWCTRKIRQATTAMVLAKKRELAKVPADQVYKLNYDDLCEDPLATTLNLCEFLKIEPADSVIENAAGLVNSHETGAAVV